MHATRYRGQAFTLRPAASGKGADPGTAAQLVGTAGYLADLRPPPGSLLNGGAGEHRPAP